MSPHVKDMTDKQRRWWFAHLNEGAENKRRRGNERSADTRRTGEDRWPERTYDEGFMAGWLYVLNRKRGAQHPQRGDDSQFQGFRQGATEASDWLRRMINGCDELCDKIEAVWEALVDYVALQKQANPTNPGDNLISERDGPIGTYQEELVAQSRNRYADEDERLHSTAAAEQPSAQALNGDWSKPAEAGTPRTPDLRLRPEDMEPFLKELASQEFRRAVATGLSKKSDLDRLTQSIKEKLVNRMPQDDSGKPEWPSITVNWKTRSELARDKAEWAEKNPREKYEMTVQQIGELGGEPLFVVYKFRAGLELRKEFDGIDLMNRTGDALRKLFR